MYPIRLLAEAKCYDKPVGIWAVRNFVGALKDIAENYFVADKLSKERLLTYQRFTDCGSFFSATSYTRGAQRYALAQGIFLVSYENNPILQKLIDDMNHSLESVDIAEAAKNKKDFASWFNKNLVEQPKNNYRSVYIPEDKAEEFF
jgi:hypothetical protein